MKISRTFKEKKIDNFKIWREHMKELGKMPKDYHSFKESEELAEYIGVVLGDGNISQFPRTERIIIVGNASNEGFIKRYAKITESLFNKKPYVYKVKGSNAVRISLYQKKISERLKIPTGSRHNVKISVPIWIWKHKEFIISFLRGLFESEGSLSIHLPTYTYNFAFSNRNQSLLIIVTKSLKLLGFHPEVRNYAIRLRKRAEVFDFKNLIKFREY